MTCLWLCGSSPVFANSLALQKTEAPAKRDTLIEQPDQLPHSRVALGDKDILKAWLAGPTDRYQHGVLGDDLEASQLVVELPDGDVLKLELPHSRVFEDLEPRLQDLDGDNNDEILVVESDVSLGASLAIYSVVNRRITRRAMTPFLGQSHRWLNPLGVGDFDADGSLDVAIVVTPHIGGILRLYHFTEPTLSQFGEIRGVSTHQIGSTELGLGRVVTLRSGSDGLLLPNQSRRALILFHWSSNNIDELDRVNLPARISLSLMPVGINRWRFGLDDGKYMEIRVD
ncbi:MAG: hypothetical protein QNI91_19095 [Arenicellales bacterium]|nr:hypothetical protein [Arenicellales bacterium]